MLIGRVYFNRRIIRKIRHHAAAWDTKLKGHMVAISWSVEKGDWWKYRNEDVAKFFSCEWRKKSDEYTRTGVYIGRLAIIYQNSLRGG